MPFEPGNQAAKGRTNPREFADMLRVAVKEARGDKTVLRMLADQLVERGLNGDVPALKEIGDRLDGKVPQGITGPGSSGEHLFGWLPRQSSPTENDSTSGDTTTPASAGE